ncbi:MAG: Bax inhibitor-1/YccA family protein [Pseudomonadota bacterium]
MAEFETVRRAGAGTRSVEIDEGLRIHMTKVYGLMSVGMVVTAAAAWIIAQLATTSSPSVGAVQIFSDTYLTPFGQALYLSPLRWVIMFAPLAVLFLGMGAMINRLSVGAAQIGFYAFGGLVGLSLSSIMIVYTEASIVQTFLITAIAFMSLSMWGYTTKKDISGWGSFLIMGLIGVILASIINIFLESSALQFAVSVIGILVFAGLTAYDTQRIKNEYLQLAHHGQTNALGKAAIFAALSLYLNFINMFIMLIQFLGVARE